MGLFVTAVVGFYTIYDLWELFGDLKMPKVDPPLDTLNLENLTSVSLAKADLCGPFRFASRVSHCAPHFGVCLGVRDPLCHFDQVRSWGFSHEVKHSRVFLIFLLLSFP